MNVGPDYPPDLGLELDRKLVALIVTVLTVSMSSSASSP